MPEESRHQFSIWRQPLYRPRRVPARYFRSDSRANPSHWPPGFSQHREFHRSATRRRPGDLSHPRSSLQDERAPSQNTNRGSAEILLVWSRTRCKSLRARPPSNQAIQACWSLRSPAAKMSSALPSKHRQDQTLCFSYLILDHLVYFDKTAHDTTFQARSLSFFGFAAGIAIVASRSHRVTFTTSAPALKLNDAIALGYLGWLRSHVDARVRMFAREKFGGNESELLLVTPKRCIESASSRFNLQGQTWTST